MTLFGINVLATLRQRLSAVLGAFAVSFMCCLCGALSTFVLAPRQAVQAFSISRMPIMDAAAVEAAAPGSNVLFTGVLTGNTPELPGSNLVAYRVEEWTVTVTQDSEDSSESRSGRWESAESHIPNLTLDVGGTLVSVLTYDSASLSGALHEEIVPGAGPEEATYEGQPLPEGSRRYEGLEDGDLTTVFGKKSSTGDVLPTNLFAGDRVAFEENQRQAASGLLFGGICAMALSPVVLILGLLGAIFYRRRMF